MKSIANINSSDLLTIDIEVVRLSETFEKLAEDYRTAWSYKLKHEGEMPSEEELADKWSKMASLYGEFSKVCAISMTYMKDGVLKCKSYFGADEKEILNNFAKDLAAFQKFNPNYRLIGHAAKYYDFPILCKRYIINELDIPHMLDESGAKPWEMKNMDTNELWKSFGTGPGSSLQALCVALGVPVSKVDLVGDEVGEAYFRGELERIAKYCSLDTIATFNVFRKFKKEPIFAFEDVVYVR
jgi:hypothetical protein